MIAPESAAKGINLQFCMQGGNYDLPHPFQRTDQRIGRCHRFDTANCHLNFISLMTGDRYYVRFVDPRGIRNLEGPNGPISTGPSRPHPLYASTCPPVYGVHIG